jgi:hypothetical protein
MMSIAQHRCFRWAFFYLPLSLVAVSAWVIPSTRISIQRRQHLVPSPLFEKRPKEKEITIAHETDVPITTTTMAAPRSFPASKAASDTSIQSVGNTTSTTTAAAVTANIRKNATMETVMTPLKGVPTKSAVEESDKEEAESTSISASNVDSSNTSVPRMPSKSGIVGGSNDLLFQEEQQENLDDEEDVRFMQVAIELAQLEYVFVVVFTLVCWIAN